MVGSGNSVPREATTRRCTWTVLSTLSSSSAQAAVWACRSASFACGVSYDGVTYRTNWTTGTQAQRGCLQGLHHCLYRHLEFMSVETSCEVKFTGKLSGVLCPGPLQNCGSSVKTSRLQQYMNIHSNRHVVCSATFLLQRVHLCPERVVLRPKCGEFNIIVQQLTTKAAPFRMIIMDGGLLSINHHQDGHPRARLRRHDRPR